MSAASPVPGEAPRGRPWSAALALGGFFLLEFLLFDLVGAKHHTWVFPRWNDQIQYLTESYTGYEYARTHGLLDGLWQSLVNRSAQGTLHDTFALLVFTVAGPSRSAALSLNVLALIAWQAALFGATRRLTGSTALAWIAAVLPLSLSWAFRAVPGSAYDFRLDHMAMCAIGVALAAAWRADGMSSRRWSVAFGAAVGATMTLRFLTGAYFLAIFVGLAVWLALQPERWRRLLNLVLAAATATALAGSFFWINRQTVWDYYAIGHFTGPESAIRDTDMGLGASTTWVFGRLITEHLGAVFWLVAIATLVVLTVGRCTQAAPATTNPRSHPSWFVPAWFLLAPALILTLHAEKSELTISAAVPGAIGLVLTAAIAVARGAAPRWIASAAGVAVLGSGVHYLIRQARDPHPAEFAGGARQVNGIADYIVRTSQAAGLATPRVAVDAVTDCLDAQVLRVIAYERQHLWIPFLMTLPTGIAAENEALLMERLEASHFVMLTESAPEGPWPFDRQLAALRPKTRAWCDENLQFVRTFDTPDRHMRLYQRREIPIEGGAGSPIPP